MAPSSAVTLPIVRFADTTFITEMKWCKCKAHPYHEFVTFTVEERATFRRSVILLERNTSEGRQLTDGELKDVEDDPAEGVIETHTNKYSDLGTATQPHADASPPASATHGQASSSRQANLSPTSLTASVAVTSARSPESSLPISRMMDIMVFSTSGQDGFVPAREQQLYTLSKLDIHGEYISVPQLAVLADAIYNQHVRYSLLYSHCYWFAMAVYHGVKNMCPPGSFKELDVNANKAGMYGRFRIVKSETLVSVKPDFDRAWVTLQKEVAEARRQEATRKQQEFDAEMDKIKKETEQFDREAEQFKREAEQIKRETEQIKKERKKEIEQISSRRRTLEAQRTAEGRT